ncbi:MAG: Gfo/Idh/MocA family oxidoreductase [Pseudomonadota bacterium]
MSDAPLAGMAEAPSLRSDPPPVKVLILGTGLVAQRHVDSYTASGRAHVVAAAEPDAERRNAFCELNGIPERYASLDEALNAGTFDAVSNATPDAVHHATTMRALEAGKHVFCEKPLALSYPLAAEMAQAAQSRGLVNMVNLTYRQGGAIHEARRLVESGAIGEVRHVNARYLQSWLVGNHWGTWHDTPAWLWRLSVGHGSTGTLGDVGIHILDYASFGSASEIIGLTCQLRTFPKAPGDRIGEYRLDANDTFVMLVDFDNGALGTVQATRYATGHSNDVMLEIYGTAGGLRVHGDTFWSSLETCLGANVHTQRWIPREFTPAPTLFAEFARAIQDGTGEGPDFARGATLQRLIDAGMTRGTGRSIPPVADAAPPTG